MYRKKMFIILAVVMLLSLILTACEPETIIETVVETVIETVEVEGETVEVIVEREVEVLKDKEILIYNSYASDPAPREADEEIVQMFMDKYPQYDVIHSTINHEDFKQAIRAYLTASAPPDVMTWFAGERARFFIDNDQIMDISDVWEGEGWVEDYPAGFKALSSVDGKQYFLPTSWYWWAVYYRVSVFEELGLEPPTTWDEFIEVCETLKENGKTPITIGTKYRWTTGAWFDYLNMRINGPEFHIDLMLGKESYEDERVLAVFDAWRELLDNDYFIEDAAAYTWSEALEPFITGEAGMYLMGDFIRDSLPTEIMDDLDFFRFPIMDPAVLIGEDAPTDGYFIAANSQNPEAAKAFLAYLGSVEVQTYNAEKLGRLPTHTGVDRSMFNAAQQKGLALIDGADYVAQFYDRDTRPEVADMGMNVFMEFWDDPGNIARLLEMLAELDAYRMEVFGAD
ncbi:MAG: ABC transporter substrate-binding protein [Brevefilum sp.]|nr:ABC transporter substrate-binding protein [Brevefilum sp.]